MMKAAWITGHGGNEVVALGECARPARSAGQVLVRLRAATVNRVDLYMRDSGAGITHRLPQIMGLDGAGTVEEVDADEALLKPGQPVVLHPGVACGRCEFCLRGATGGRGVDVVFENVGAAVWSAAMKSLVRGGRLVTCGATTGDQPPADLRRIFIRQLQILGSTLGNLDEFGDLLGFVARTGLKPVIDSEYPLDQVHAALTRLESGAQFGKVALRID